MTYTPSGVLQYNEYYPFGLQTAESWTRDAATPNNFLGNGGTELNTTSKMYDLDFRNYDPALARMHQVDLMADKYGSQTPYHFALNNPVMMNDPTGLNPGIGDIAYGQYEPGPHGDDQVRPLGGDDRGAEWTKVTTYWQITWGTKQNGNYDPANSSSYVYSTEEYVHNSLYEIGSDQASHGQIVKDWFGKHESKDSPIPRSYCCIYISSVK